VKRRYEAGERLLKPGPLLQDLGEVTPPLGNAEPFDAARHAMVDTLERPTTPAVKASDHRMRLLHKGGVLPVGMDASVTRMRRTVSRRCCATNWRRRMSRR